MGRSPCCAKEGLNRGAWTAAEDKILTKYIKIHGEGKWRHLPKRAGLKRCGKSCRLRWLNYLRPDIKRGNITRDEEDLIIRLQKLLGNRWSLIAGRLPGRTDNEIKNYWNTNIGKKLQNGNKEVGSTSSSLAGQESDPDHELDLKPEPPCLIRTKATRCTKVMLTREFQPLMTTEYPSSTDHHHMNNNNVTCDYEKIMEAPPSFVNSEGITNNLPLEFMVDFEIDQSVFSDLMNMDMSSSEPSCSENEVVAVEVDNNNSSVSTTRKQQGCYHHLLSSPTISNDETFVNVSDDSILLSSEVFQSMSALVENEEFDWL